LTTLTTRKGPLRGTIEESVQEATLRLLERGRIYDLASLRTSILTNGYVPLEGKFLVIEGNRRVAALKTLLRDHRDGSLTLTQDQLTSFSHIPAVVLEETGDDLISDVRVIMGIRHVAGIRQWGAYQSALLIAELVDDESKDFATIGDHLGITAVEASRRYRAIKALRAMEEDELYSRSAKPEFYRFFQELIIAPDLRDRFGWDNNKKAFVDTDKARQFFELVAPQDPDTQPKLRTYKDVRALNTIIGNAKAMVALLDPDVPLSEAMAIADAGKTEGKETDLAAELKDFEHILSNALIEEIKALSEDDVARIEVVMGLLQQRLDDYRKLQK